MTIRWKFSLEEFLHLRLPWKSQSERGKGPRFPERRVGFPLGDGAQTPRTWTWTLCVVTQGRSTHPREPNELHKRNELFYGATALKIQKFSLLLYPND